MSSSSQPKVAMYGYWRSSCSARLRIALYLREIPFEHILVKVADGEHRRAPYAEMNPNMTVPTLAVTLPSSAKTAYITQSAAAVEYIEEVFPDHLPRLLPAGTGPEESLARAQIRSIVQVSVADIQGATSSRLLRQAESLGHDQAAWARDFTARGFRTIEGIMGGEGGLAGKYCVGDQLSMADVCLAPAVWNAERWGLGLDEFPTMARVYANLMEIPAFVKGHYKNQDDYPRELR